MGVHRFMVVDPERFILAEPDREKLGWGHVRLAEDLQHVKAAKDKGNPVWFVIDEADCRRHG